MPGHDAAIRLAAWRFHRSRSINLFPVRASAEGWAVGREHADPQVRITLELVEGCFEAIGPYQY